MKVRVESRIPSINALGREQTNNNLLSKHTDVSLQEIIFWYLFCIGNISAYNSAGIKQHTRL